jgi:hypothetical protein
VLEQMVSGKVNSRSLVSLPPWAWRDAKRAALAARATADTNPNSQAKKQWGADSGYKSSVTQIASSVS